MFGSTILEVGIGVVFTFLTVSLICGSVTETVASVMSWRSKTLMAGIQKMVNDQNGDGLALQLYNSALVHPRGNGEATSLGDIEQPPSYIDPKHFAQALLETVTAGKSTFPDISNAIAAMPESQLKTLLATLVTHANADLTTLRNNVASWFDAGMDRVTGEYKRRTQLWCFAIGFVIAAFLNIDTLHVAQVLWQNPNLAKGIAVHSEPTAQDALKAFQSATLPLGWTAERSAVWSNWCQDFAHFRPCAMQVFGWALTAGSTLFGTSFWYDALSSVLKLRGSGPPPPLAPLPAPPPAPIPAPDPIPVPVPVPVAIAPPAVVAAPPQAPGLAPGAPPATPTAS